MVRNYTDSELLEKVKSIEKFRIIPNERWILGVRSKADLPNKFDDKFYVFEGEKFIVVLTGTTHPGVSILKSFDAYNKNGAAVVQANMWYYNLWSFGQHKGKMPALLQTGAQVNVFRDGNKNDKSEEIGAITRGFYGINFHTNTYDFSKDSIKIKKEDVNNWSAGCQVTNDREKYLSLMEYFEKAKKDKQQGFVSYCLINEF